LKQWLGSPVGWRPTLFQALHFSAFRDFRGSYPWI
jgi:hypothetical protein